MKLLFYIGSVQTWLCRLNYWRIFNFLSVAVAIIITPSPSEDNDGTTLDVENDKDSLRKAVEGVFNNLYGVYVSMCIYTYVHIKFVGKLHCNCPLSMNVLLN